MAGLLLYHEIQIKNGPLKKNTHGNEKDPYR
jgi:hypothetical protein